MVLYLQKICRDSTDESHKLLSFSYCYHPTLAEYISHNLKKKHYWYITINSTGQCIWVSTVFLNVLFVIPESHSGYFITGLPNFLATNPWPGVALQEVSGGQVS